MGKNMGQICFDTLQDIGTVRPRANGLNECPGTYIGSGFLSNLIWFWTWPKHEGRSDDYS